MIGELGKKNKRVEGKDGIGEGRTLSKIWMTETTCRGHLKRKCRAWKIKKETEKKTTQYFSSQIIFMLQTLIQAHLEIKAKQK